MHVSSFRIFFLSLVALTFFLGGGVSAYTPTQADSDLLQAIEDKIEVRYPGDVEQLLTIYAKLDVVKAQAGLIAGEQGTYLIHELQQMMIEWLFDTTEVCIDSYAQVTDTVEIFYEVHTSQGDLLRKTEKPYVFNVGAGQVRKSLDRGVLGVGKDQTTQRIVSTRSVDPDSEGSYIIEVDYEQVVRSGVEPVVGRTFVFGSSDHLGAVLGTVVSMDGKYVRFDFAESNDRHLLTLDITLDRVSKGCAWRE